MITKEERRKTALRLREIAGGCESVSAHDIAMVLELEAHGTYTYYADCVMRLAELIDPSDTTESCRDNAACDRDALLVIADEMEKSVDRRKVRGYARRIREACGIRW